MRAGTPDRLRPPPFFDFDPVGILSLSDQIGEAYAIADRYRVQGTSVVLGGLDAPVSTRVRGPAGLLLSFKLSNPMGGRVTEEFLDRNPVAAHEKGPLRLERRNEGRHARMDGG